MAGLLTRLCLLGTTAVHQGGHTGLPDLLLENELMDALSARDYELKVGHVTDEVTVTNPNPRTVSMMTMSRRDPCCGGPRLTACD